AAEPCAPSSTSSDAARVEQIPQVIAEEVERHDGEKDEHTRRENPGKLSDALHVLRIGEQVPPARIGLPDAEPEQRQSALPEDEPGDAERRRDDGVSKRRRNDVTYDDAGTARAESTRALHVVELANRRHHAANDASEPRPADEAHDDDDHHERLCRAE